MEEEDQRPCSTLVEVLRAGQRMGRPLGQMEEPKGSWIGGEVNSLANHPSTSRSDGRERESLEEWHLAFQGPISYESFHRQRKRIQRHYSDQPLFVNRCPRYQIWTSCRCPSSQREAEAKKEDRRLHLDWRGVLWKGSEEGVV